VVFHVTAVVEDLSMADRLLHQALDEGEGARQTGYFHRGLVARVFEAGRAVYAADDASELREWGDDIGPALTGPLNTLRDYYTPRGESTVDRLYALVRHRTVHHSWPGSDELRDTLAVAADEEAWIEVDHSAGTLHYQWPEAVMMRALHGDLTDDAQLSSFKDSVRTLSAITAAFGSLGRVALTHHLARRRIDYGRLVSWT
jgi:hypothetical protein